MMKSLGHVALALVSLGTLAVAPTGLAPKDDFFIAVQDTVLEIRAADLLANDGAAGPPDRYRIIIVADPEHGVLQRTAEGFAYLAHAGYYGPDGFAYSVREGNVTSLRAAVRIRVSPDAIALRGDFDGDGRTDWGWFDSKAAAFHACRDYPRPDAMCTVAWTAPISLAGRAPIVGDWNADGTDDFGLFDAATGWFHLKIVRSTANTISFPLGAGGGTEHPIAGDWNGDGFDTVGLHRPAASRFLLRNRNAPGPFDYDFVFGLGLRDPGLLSLRRRGVGFDAVALHAERTLQVFVPKTGGRTAEPTRCEARAGRLPIEYVPGQGLLVYNPHLNVASDCDNVHMPVDVYIPPD